ncbi:MAG: transglycosylase SLT domain-containing protein, partial [Bacteroidales bacterium]|nr:transglycosylase SLT domain-containing protein [Bacteroidales bacterium]
MNRKNLSFLFLVFASAISFTFIILISARNPKEYVSVEELLLTEKDLERSNYDTIYALLYINASDYFIYKGTPAGFQYDLLKELGRSLQKTIIIDLESDPQVSYNAIFYRKYDIVAMDYFEKPWIDFYLTHSLPHSSTHAVLIENTDYGPDSLLKKTLHVPAFFPISINKNSLPYAKDWEIVYHQEYKIDELVEMMQQGEIHYIACDYNEAITILPFYSELEMTAPLSAPRKRIWTLKSNNDSINNEINGWLMEFKETPKYKRLVKRYLTESSPVIVQSFTNNMGKQISRFDDIIKKEAEKHDFDWRFVASLIYQESKFIDGLVGRGGSYGLMQLMPTTGSRFGVNQNSSPEQQIKGGVAYLNYLRKMFPDIEDPREQMKFIAAAYNSGPGHIHDAQRLAEKYKQNRLSWDDVSHFLTL